MPTQLRAISYLPPQSNGSAWDVVSLRHDERRLRRRLVTTVHDIKFLVDFPQPVTVDQGGTFVLEDGRMVDIVAAEEHLYEIRGRDPIHLMQLCWHIGNRHTKAQIEHEWEGIGARVLILRDHVLRDMLIGLGATVVEISEPFWPQEGAYAGHAHATEAHALLRK